LLQWTMARRNMTNGWEMHCAVYFDRVDFNQVWCSGYYTNAE
jgi:hypothetical protein